MSDAYLEFANELTLRNQLIMLDSKQLREIYQDKGDYLIFLNSVISLIQHDSPILLFSPDFLDKIYDTIEIHRFHFSEKEVYDCVNEIIGYLNHVKTMNPMEQSIVKGFYMATQEMIREISFHDSNSFLASMGYDAVLFHALKDNNLDSLQDPDYPIMSLNFLIKACPDFFRDPDIQKRAMEVINRVGEKTRPFTSKKKYIKRLLQNVQNIPKKEE